MISTEPREVREGEQRKDAAHGLSSTYDDALFYRGSRVSYKDSMSV
jgi:hypothetical protein